MGRRALDGFAAVVVAVAALGCRTAETSGAHDARLMDAEAAVLAEHWQEAERAFLGVAAGADPEGLGARCQYWIGVCRVQLGDLDGAHTAFAAALVSRAPEWQARTRLALGDLYWQERNWPAAREMYVSARRDAEALVDADRLRLRERLARTRIRAGDWSGGGAELHALADEAALPALRWWAPVARAVRERYWCCLVGTADAAGARALVADWGDRGFADVDWRPAEGGAAGADAVVAPFDSLEAAEAEAERLRAAGHTVAVWP